MPASPVIPAGLTRPETFAFPANRPYADNVHEAGGRISILSSGHIVLYGRHGRRVLFADPEGIPLHECEWDRTSEGGDRLARARVRLDWGCWVGIKPGGLTNATRLDLSVRSGWQHLRADDLRHMAARALQVPIEEVRFFYDDRDLLIDGRGTATIRHIKDALYVLEDGTFEHARFMACMGAMHWHDIDFLPVVELFQSLLPGTGSAVFELIRGLYDDQNANRSTPRALRYRGIPTYPSAAAFHLFSAFFSPQTPRGEAPFGLFMDAPRSHEVIWLAPTEPPRRYFAAGGRVCATIARRTITRLTLADDVDGLSYGAPSSQHPAPCDRSVTVHNREVILLDRGARTTLELPAHWGPLEEGGDRVAPSYPVRWSDVFKGTPPRVHASEAFSAVLLYPDDEQEIGELSSQPFVVDYLQDVLEQDPAVAARLTRADRVLVHRFDGAISGCIDTGRPRDYTVLYTSDAFAQRHAQLLWNRFAAAQQLSWLERIRLYPVTEAPHDNRPFDVVYEWIPFALFGQTAALQGIIAVLMQRMRAGATAFVVGPETLFSGLLGQDLFIDTRVLVCELPSFRMHQTILPKARLKPGLTLYGVHRA